MKSRSKQTSSLSASLTPDARIRYQAVVDFIELEVTTARPTNAMALRRHSSLPYVEPLNAGPGRAASRFALRVHDLSSWAELEPIIGRVRSFASLVDEPRVTKLEVALDAYVQHGAAQDLARIAAASYKFLNRLADPDNHRIWVGKGLKLVPPTTPLFIEQQLAAGCTLYIGDHENAPFSQRIYVKCTDRGKSLPQEQWRARLEVTMQGAGLPFTALDQARGFDFAYLAPWFKFSQLKRGLPSWSISVAEIRGQIGAKEARCRPGGGVRVRSPLTRADIQHNRMAYDALRYLTRRMGSFRGAQRTPSCGFCGRSTSGNALQLLDLAICS